MKMNVSFYIVQRLRPWPNSKTTLVLRLVFASCAPRSRQYYHQGRVCSGHFKRIHLEGR